MNTSSSDKSSTSHPRLRKLLIWLVSIAAVVVIALVALPIVTARVATSWLQDNGASDAAIENVDINLFTGTVRVVGLEAGADAERRLHVGLAEVDIRWWPLASKRILVESVRLSDTQIDVAPAEDGWQIGGLTIRPAAEGSEPDTDDEDSAGFDWGVGSESIALSNVSLTYSDPLFATDVEINEIAIGSHYSWQAGEETDLLVDMQVNGSPINLNSTLVPWGEQQSISGSLQVDDYELAGHVDALEALAGLEDVRGTVNLDLTTTVSLDENGVIDALVTGPLSVRDFNVTRETLTFSNGELAWQGQVDLRFPVAGDEPFLLVEGGLQLADTHAMLLDQQLDVQLGGMDYAGRLTLANGQDSDAFAIALTAMLSGEALTVDHTGLPYALARLDSFTLSDIQVTDLRQASLSQVQLGGLTLLADAQAATESDSESDNAVFHFDQLALAQVDLESPTRLVVDTVTLEAPSLSVVRTAEGEIARVNELLALYADDSASSDTSEQPVTEPGDTEPEAEEVPSAGEPFTFAINRVQVQAEQLLAYEDQSVTPQFNYSLNNLDLTIENIDSGSDAPMAVQLATGNDAMSLSAQGDVAAFADAMAVNLEASVSALELPRFSPYIPGYNIDRGRLNLDSTVAINGEMLDVQNNVMLEAIRLAGKGGGDNEILAQGMAMPLDAALDLLRDSDDRITLDLPVTGSLSDPQFDSADIIRTVMQNALQNAAMSYVTNALQPLGTILLVGNLASRAAAPSFAPLDMRVGEPSLSPENREYLFKIGELLTERPSLQLSFCGVVTESDRQALAAVALEEMIREAQQAQEAAASDAAVDSTETETVPAEPVAPEISDGDLLQLAAMRTDAAIAFLVDEVDIASERLFSCRETIDGEEEARPRVRISL